MQTETDVAAHLDPTNSRTKAVNDRGPATDSSEPVSTARTLLDFLENGPRWVGDDLDDCYQQMVALRGKAEF